jgi:hypothetical protein
MMREEAIEILEEIARDLDCYPTSRVTAIRTLARARQGTGTGAERLRRPRRGPAEAHQEVEEVPGLTRVQREDAP